MNSEKKSKEIELIELDSSIGGDQTIKLPKAIATELSSYLSLQDSVNLSIANKLFNASTLEEKKRVYKNSLPPSLRASIDDSKAHFSHYYLTQYQGMRASHVRALEAIKNGQLISDLTFSDLTTINDNNGKNLAWWMRHLYKTESAYSHFKDLLDDFFNQKTEIDENKLLKAVICGQQDIIDQTIAQGTPEKVTNLLQIACYAGELELVEKLLDKIKSPSKALLQQAFIESCLAGHADIAEKFFKYAHINANVKIQGKPLIDIVAGKGYFALSQLLLEKGASYHVDSQKEIKPRRTGAGVPIPAYVFTTTPGYESSVDPLKSNLIIRAMLIEKIHQIKLKNPLLQNKTVDNLLEALNNGKPVDKIEGVRSLTGELAAIYKKALSLPANKMVFSDFKKEAWLRIKFTDDKKISSKSLDKSTLTQETDRYKP